MPVNLLPRDLPKLVPTMLRNRQSTRLRAVFRDLQRGRRDWHSILNIRTVPVHNNRRAVSHFRDVLLSGGLPFKQYGVGQISRRVHAMASAEACLRAGESAKTEGVQASAVQWGHLFAELLAGSAQKYESSF